MCGALKNTQKPIGEVMRVKEQAMAGKKQKQQLWTNFSRLKPNSQIFDKISEDEKEWL